MRKTLFVALCFSVLAFTALAFAGPSTDKYEVGRDYYRTAGSTAVTIPNTYYKNYVVDNYGQSGATTFSLATAIKGAVITFINTAGQTINVDPASTDRIYPLCSAAGDKATDNGTLGNVLTITCPTPTYWIIKQKIGTWTDGN